MEGCNGLGTVEGIVIYPSKDRDCHIPRSTRLHEGMEQPNNLIVFNSGRIGVCSRGSCVGGGGTVVLLFLIRRRRCGRRSV